MGEIDVMGYGRDQRLIINPEAVLNAVQIFNEIRDCRRDDIVL